MWQNTLKLGIKNLLLHKLRSFLTVLGVILGVGSVVAMLAIGEGSKREALERIRELGATNVIIRSVKPGQKDDGGDAAGGQQQVSRVLEYGLTHKDFDRLLATLPTVEKALPISLFRKDAQAGDRRIPNARVLATTPDYLAVKNLAKRRGRFLTPVDMKQAANVAVLGAGSAQRLFSFEDPLGKTVLLGHSGRHRPSRLQQRHLYPADGGVAPLWRVAVDPLGWQPILRKEPAQRDYPRGPKFELGQPHSRHGSPAAATAPSARGRLRSAGAARIAATS
jgi:hypothetical protein